MKEEKKERKRERNKDKGKYNEMLRESKQFERIQFERSLIIFTHLLIRDSAKKIKKKVLINFFHN